MNPYIELVLLSLGLITAIMIIYIAILWFVTVPLSNFIKWLAGE